MVSFITFHCHCNFYTFNCQLVWQGRTQEKKEITGGEEAGNLFGKLRNRSGNHNNVITTIQQQSVQVCDQEHCEAAVVLLVCHPPCIFQHLLCGC